MDLFDKLPDDIIIHILSFLPTKFAVLTSVLSRRWKFLWCFGINSLVFDDRVSFRDFYHIAQHRYYVPDRVLYFHNFIDKVLKLSKASQVESFYLMMYSCLRIPNSVSSWIDEIVNKRKAKKIEIYFGDDVCSSGFKVFLPLQNFNSTTLRVLKLHFCNSNPLAGSKINNAKRLFLPNLKVLHFWMESFQVRCWLLFYLLRASPKLEVAYFGGHSGNSKAFFNIYAPSLKRLRMKFRSIDSSSKFLINAPILEELVVVDESFQKHIIKSNCLVRAKLDIGLPYLRKVQRLHVYINRFCKLLSKIYHVKFLNLKAHTMDALSISCNHRHDSLPQFLSLRRLQLRFLNYSSWDVLPKLLECSPNLEVLVLSKDFKGKDAEFRRDSTWIQPSSVPACLLSCLRWVEVWDCESHQVEFDLISYLLKHGEVLSTFLVELLPANSREDLRFREKLMVISSVSRTCKLKISAYPHCSQHNGFSPDVEDFLFQELQWRMPPQKLSFEDLRLCTNYFSDENLIVRTKYFKIYRGKHYQSGAYDSLAKDVVVKRWIIPAKSPFNKYKEDSMRGFREELKLLKHPNFYCHPYFMNLLGYCVEDSNERLGVVYDFKALDCLENLIPKDSFKWLQRIKVALVLACILEYMHKKHGDLPSVTPRIKPAYVILDEDYMPVLCNFERKEIPNIYREDENYDYGIGIGYRYSRKDLDVENYGLTLLGLISKRVHRCPIGKRHTSECVTFRPIGKRHTSECVTFRRWATMQQADMDITSSLCKSQVPLVHKELMDDPTYDFVDGLKITRLAMRCLERPQHKPSMHAIVKYLCKLRVIKENWDVIDCDNVISTYLHIQVP